MPTRPQDYWNTPDPALNPTLPPGAMAPLGYLPFNPLLARQPEINAMATRGPEDVGRNNLAVDFEQALGTGLKALSYPSLKLQQGLGNVWDYITGTVQPATPAPAEPSAEAPGPIPGTPFAAQQETAGQAQGLSLANMLGGGTAPMQLPAIPPPQGGGGAGFLNQLRALAPSTPPQMEEVYERPMPIAPDLGPAQQYIAGMQAPTEVDKGVRQNRMLVSILGAIAQGANSAAANGGGFGSQLAQAGALVSQAYGQELDRVAAEDWQYQQDVQQYQALRFQAEQSLRDIQTRHAQASQDVTTFNAENQVGARNRFAVAQQQQAEAERQWKIALAEAGWKVAESQARAQERYLDRQFEAQIAQMKINAEFQKPLVMGDQVYVRTADGGLRPYAPGGLNGFKALLKTSQTDGLLPGVKKKLEQQGNFMMAMEYQRPDLAQEVVADSLLEKAPDILPDFDEVQKKINDKAMAAGYLPGTKEYPDFYRNEMVRELMVRMNEPGAMQGLSKIDPFASYYTRVFGQ